MCNNYHAAVFNSHVYFDNLVLLFGLLFTLITNFTKICKIHRFLRTIFVQGQDAYHQTEIHLKAIKSYTSPEYC